MNRQKKRYHHLWHNIVGSVQLNMNIEKFDIRGSYLGCHEVIESILETVPRWRPHGQGLGVWGPIGHRQLGLRLRLLVDLLQGRRGEEVLLGRGEGVLRQLCYHQKCKTEQAKFYVQFGNGKCNMILNKINGVSKSKASGLQGGGQANKSQASVPGVDTLC